MVKQMKHHFFSLSQAGIWWRDDNAFYVCPVFRPGEWVVFSAVSFRGVFCFSLDEALLYADICDS